MKLNIRLYFFGLRKRHILARVLALNSLRNICYNLSIRIIFTTSRVVHLNTRSYAQYIIIESIEVKITIHRAAIIMSLK